MIVRFEQSLGSDEDRARVRSEFERRYGSVDNAYKTLILEGGADVSVVGSDFRAISFAETQAGGENRIATASGVPSIVLGFQSGLDASTYSNYGQARRAFGDLLMRPLWRFAAGALDVIVDTPVGARLWYDSSRVSFLQEDVSDEAQIRMTKANTIRTLVDGGYKPDSVVLAVESGDFRLLEHTDLFSVQLQPPGTVSDPDPDPEPEVDDDAA
jgi:phage portal protein BeeE